MRKLLVGAVVFIGACIFIVANGVQAPFFISAGANFVDIYTAEQLQNISGWGRWRLTADIDLTDIDWTPINISGTFDGDNHIITGLNEALFGLAVGATIENLHVQGSGTVAEQKIGDPFNVARITNSSFQGNGYMITSATGTIELQSVHTRSNAPIIGNFTDGILWVYDSSTCADSVTGGSGGQVFLTHTETSATNPISIPPRPEYSHEPCDEGCDEYKPYVPCEDISEVPGYQELPPIPGGNPCDDCDEIASMSTLPNTPNGDGATHNGRTPYAVILAILGVLALCFVGGYTVWNVQRRRKA